MKTSPLSEQCLDVGLCVSYNLLREAASLVRAEQGAHSWVFLNFARNHFIVMFL